MIKATNPCPSKFDYSLNGICKIKKYPGEPCAESDQCLSSRCLAGACLAAPAGSLTTGHPCSQNDECFSGVCGFEDSGDAMKSCIAQENDALGHQIIVIILVSCISLAIMSILCACCVKRTIRKRRKRRDEKLRNDIARDLHNGYFINTGHYGNPIHLQVINPEDSVSYTGTGINDASHFSESEVDDTQSNGGSDVTKNSNSQSDSDTLTSQPSQLPQ